MFIVGEEHKGVSSGASIRLVHEEDAFFVIEDINGLLSLSEELELKEKEGLGAASRRSTAIGVSCKRS
jgi:hypothetical protein